MNKTLGEMLKDEAMRFQLTKAMKDIKEKNVKNKLPKKKIRKPVIGKLHRGK